MIYILIFIIGAAVGSFLNVCIYRLPREESLIRPSSHCPKCNKPIPWYDNIPILSYTMLKAKCRFCKKNISIVYFLVELITPAIFCVLYYNFGLGNKFFIFSALSCALIVVTFVDFQHMIIPDQISIGGLIIGILISFLYPALHNTDSRFMAIFESAKGIIAGGGLIYILGIFGKIVFKKEAMGGGDVKLLAMIGSFLGLKLALFTFFFAPFLGIIPALYLKFRKKNDYVPYGPFLSISSLAAILWGNKIFNYFFGFLL